MKGQGDNLQKLKGIGQVLAVRLKDAGFDTFARIAAATADEFKGIAGLPPRLVPGIIAEAAELAGGTGSGKARKSEDLKRKIVIIKEMIQAIALGLRERFGAELAGKEGKKLEKEIIKIMTSLEKVEEKIGTKGKNSGKCLATAEKRLAGLAGDSLAKVDKGLKRARKSLKKIYS